MMRLVKHLGPSHALAAIVTLEELGIEKFPMTAAGKVRKNILKQLIAEHFHVNSDHGDLETLDDPLTPPLSTTHDGKESKELETSVSTDSPDLMETIQQLTDIWPSLVVNPPGRYDPVQDVADSITLLRYVNRVWRQIGKKLYLQDFMEHDTIEKQAQLLQTRNESTEEPVVSSKFTALMRQIY